MGKGMEAAISPVHAGRWRVGPGIMETGDKGQGAER